MAVEIDIALGLYRQAVTASSDILRKDEVNIGAIRNIARCHLALGNLDLAGFVIMQGLRFRNDAVLQFLLGQVYIKRERWQGAEAALTAAIEKSQTF